MKTLVLSQKFSTQPAIAISGGSKIPARFLVDLDEHPEHAFLLFDDVGVFRLLWIEDD